MDIFQFAMDKEKRAEEYYRQLAEKAKTPGLANILNMLAAEEVKHYQVVEAMKADSPIQIAETPVLQNAKDVFTKMKESAETFNFDISEVDLYQKACDIESASKQYYLDKAEEVEKAEHKTVFLKLAEEENKHLVLVQKLRDFVAKPQTFLEDAEFYHFDDYVEGQF